MAQLRECIRKSEHDDLNYNHELRKLLACSISELDKNRSILWSRHRTNKMDKMS